jgi:hypothetical protein
MNEFYNFEDEIPVGTRLSTSEDCKGCDGFKNDDCSGSKHCLIEELSIPHPCPDE